MPPIADAEVVAAPPLSHAKVHHGPDEFEDIECPGF
jgi:hypothetical protein